MKPYCICLLLAFNLSVSAQILNGEYISYKTSFKDEVKEESNFVEETKFNISIHINTAKDDGRIVIQDPRILEELLIYKVIRLSKNSSNDKVIVEIYNCFTDHLDIQKPVKLTFYTDEKDNLNLMISDKYSSQVFFDLVKD